MGITHSQPRWSCLPGPLSPPFRTERFRTMIWLWRVSRVTRSGNQQSHESLLNSLGSFQPRNGLLRLPVFVTANCELFHPFSSIVPLQLEKCPSRPMPWGGGESIEVSTLPASVDFRPCSGKHIGETTQKLSD